MDSVSQKKVLISYVITSIIILLVSAVMSVSDSFGNNLGAFNMSIELMISLQLVIVLVANLVLHLVFYYGGFDTSPIAKGVGIGSLLGVVYFLVSVLALDFYNINTESLQQLFGAMSGRVVEYGTGGVLTAIISVSDVHRWGVLRAF